MLSDACRVLIFTDHITRLVHNSLQRDVALSLGTYYYSQPWCSLF